MIELKPCPFCGQNPTVIEDDSYRSCMIFCTCDAEPIIHERVGELALCAEKWNRRPEPAAKVDQELLKRLDYRLIGVPIETYDDNLHLLAACAAALRTQRADIHDRELLAQFIMRHGWSTGHGESVEDLLIELEGQLPKNDCGDGK